MRPRPPAPRPSPGTPALRRPRWLPAALPALLLSACLTPSEPDPTWSEAEASIASRRLGLEVAAQAFESQGYQIGTGLDTTAGRVLSQWKVSLAPFRGDGQRKRAEARLEPLSTGRYRLQVRVQVQANVNLSDPLDISLAEWEWRPEDTVAADILLQKMLALLGEPLKQG
jgi:hypothetical protein